jgi:hypothetical protein
MDEHIKLALKDLRQETMQECNNIVSRIDNALGFRLQDLSKQLDIKLDVINKLLDALDKSNDALEKSNKILSEYIPIIQDVYAKQDKDKDRSLTDENLEKGFQILDELSRKFEKDKQPAPVQEDKWYCQVVKNEYLDLSINEDFHNKTYISLQVNDETDFADFMSVLLNRKQVKSLAQRLNELAEEMKDE